VPIEISEPTRQYNEMLPQLLEKINHFWDAQERMLLQIDDLYGRLVDTYKSWSEGIEAIRKEVIEFNKRVSFSELSFLETTFDELHRYSNECQTFNQNEKNFI
jgi:hypothetical protein